MIHSRTKLLLILFPLVVALVVALPGRNAASRNSAVTSTPIRLSTPIPPSSKVVHVIVALCDNEYQGIVPVPARIGNGDDPANNLYWGAAYGVRSFFRKASGWEHLGDVANPRAPILQRSIFREKRTGLVMVADAYRGREIRTATTDLLEYLAGGRLERVVATTREGELNIDAGSGAALVAYIGHDGLMDFSIDDPPAAADSAGRRAIVLACISHRFFADPLRIAGATPLLMTTGLMAPEAYVLHAALEGWGRNETGAQIRERAAVAYNRYQKCGLRAARGLFRTGEGG